VHRDLKPGNVIITASGQVKVLDFGLATGGGGTTSGSDPNLSHSPTLTHAATRAGVILGTAAYMSPEQARGKNVDRRTDVWSFGCVLYECLTGKPLFQGDTVSDLIARILEREPDWTALPANTPPRVRELLRKCLRKDPKERLRDIGDARLDLAQAAVEEPAGASVAAPRTSRLPWMIAVGVLAVALAASLALRPKPEALDAPTMRVSIPLPRGLEVSLEVPDVTLSPDGKSIVFAAVDSSGTTRLYVRSLRSASVRPLLGTEGAVIPFWAPDSREIAFFANSNLQRMSIDGGSAQVLAPAPSARGGAWGAGDVIVYAPSASGPLMKIPAAGGTPTVATVLDSTRGETAHRFPSFLPDGKHFLYVGIPGKNGRVDTRVTSLDESSGPVLVSSPNMATYASGHLLFNQNESVVAQPFDLGSFELRGSPKVVGDLYNVSAQYSGSPVVMASGNGTLIQREHRASAMRVALMDRSGKIVRTLALPRGRYSEPSFSPDGTRLAITHAPVGSATFSVWIVDIMRNLANRLSFSGTWDINPMWTTDGEYVVWGKDSDTGRELFWKRSDGSGAEEMLADVPNMFNDPTSVTREYVVFRSLSGTTNEDIYLVPLRGEKTPKPLIQTRYNELDAVVSPDERWMAYRSDESGRHEIYVAGFPNMDRRLRVSIDGAAPVTNASLVLLSWRDDGRELLFIGGDGRTLMSVDVQPGEHFSAGTPRPLFRFPRETVDGEISADGKTIAVILPAESETRSILNLVVNWTSELQGPE
ncbi:MAG TPA: protein kinase, partial [Candidatus Krumholzibacteria bacterium]|nr:protein kinase [Candidatus Krumholzibacteria bacterium]